MLRRIGPGGEGGVLLAPVMVMIIMTAAIVGGCQLTTTGSGTSGTTTSKPGIKTATIRVTGTPGMAFSGNYHSSVDNESVNGTTPQDFQVDYKSGFVGAFDIVSATVQKKAEDDSKLTVQILVDNQVKKEQSTSAAFGVVTVRWDTNE